MEIKGDIGQLAESVENGKTVINVAPGGIGQAVFGNARSSPMPSQSRQPAQTLFDNTDEELQWEERRCTRAIWTLRKHLFTSAPTIWVAVGLPSMIWCALQMLGVGITVQSDWLKLTWISTLGTLPGIVWLGLLRDRVGTDIRRYIVRRESVRSILRDRQMR